ncbi:transposable element Tcb2 transposase [Trichonephila clavipes]|nr:transposable element Tcb2 transposase [Trichonephila clavipes]
MLVGLSDVFHLSQLTAACNCPLRREHALWTSQQWSCVMFSDESRFSLQSDSLRTLILRAPGTRYHQENTIERHRYGGAGWLVWGGIILGSRTDLHVWSVTMTGPIYRDVILEQHVRLFRGAMGAYQTPFRRINESTLSINSLLAKKAHYDIQLVVNVNMDISNHLLYILYINMM